MNYSEHLAIGEMEENKRYAITQGGHGYSDGLWVEKEGDTLTLRHFWNPSHLNETNTDYYMLDEHDQVCYPKKEEDDLVDVLHKDIMQIIPEAITYNFEKMTLGAFFEIVYMGLYYLRDEENFVIPKHLLGAYKTYNRAGVLVITHA